MRKEKRIGLMLILFLVVVGFAYALPNTLNIQGKLTDTSDSSLSGTYNFTFRLFDVYTGGSALYEQMGNVTTDSRGTYDVILKNIDLNFSEQYYLEILVGNETLTPRINMTSTPYTFRANVSEELNKDNSYTIAGLNVTGTGTITTITDTVAVISSGAVKGVTTLGMSGDLNVSDSINLTSAGNIFALGNLSLGQKITFSLGEVIDNIVDGIVHVIGNLNVSGGLNVSGNTNLIGDLSVNRNLNVTADSGDLKTSGNLTIGDKITFSLGAVIDNIIDSVLHINKNVNISGGINTTGDLSINQNLNITAASGNLKTAGTITSGAITSSGAMEGTSLTDGTVIISSGAIKGVTTLDMSSTLNVSDAVNLTSSGDIKFSGAIIGNIGWGNLSGVSGSDNISISGGVVAVNKSFVLSTDKLGNTTGEIIQAATGSVNSTAFNRTGTDVILANTGDNVGIGTTTPSEKLSVMGNASINNTLYVLESGNVGINTSSPTQTLTVVGSLNVTGSPITLGDDATTDILNVNAYVGTDFIPTNNAKDLGSSSNRWRTGYFDNVDANNLSAGNVSIAGTRKSTFTIFTNNSGDDTEDVSLAFERGSPTTNAVLKWDFSNKYFDFNLPVNIQSNMNLSVDSPTLFVDGSINRVGIGTTTPGARLDVAGNINASGLNITGNALITGDLNVSGNAYLNNLNISGVTIASGNLELKNLTVDDTIKGATNEIVILLE